jgi:hypothetical protein
MTEYTDLWMYLQLKKPSYSRKGRHSNDRVLWGRLDFMLSFPVGYMFTYTTEVTFVENEANRNKAE